MAYTEADIAMLEQRIEDIKSGMTPESSVRFSNGNRVDYRSADDLMQLLRSAQADLNQAEGKRPPRAFRMNVSKGVF